MAFSFAGIYSFQTVVEAFHSNVILMLGMEEKSEVHKTH